MRAPAPVPALNCLSVTRVFPFQSRSSRTPHSVFLRYERERHQRGFPFDNSAIPLMTLVSFEFMTVSLRLRSRPAFIPLFRRRRRRRPAFGLAACLVPAH